MIRVQLPHHLKNLAGTNREVVITLGAEPTIGVVLNRLEEKYPVLRGTIRDQITGERRPFIRFFADGRDWSLESYESLLPDSVIDGTEPFRIVGAMAGG